MAKTRDEGRFQQVTAKEIDKQAERPEIHPIDVLGPPVAKGEAKKPEDESTHAPSKR